MKKFLIILLVVAVVGAAAFFAIKALHLFEDEDQSSVTVSDSSSVPDKSPDTSSKTDNQSSDPSDPEADSEGGGAQTAESVKVTIAVDKYTYDGKEVTLEELSDILDSLNEGTIVHIFDEQASQSAYESLVKLLDEKGILHFDAE